jgi:hypothetical protein
MFTEVLTFALAHGKNIPIEKTPKREPAVMPARLFPACRNEINNNKHLLRRNTKGYGSKTH